MKSDGGPSTYYDFKGKWVTLNDMMEDKAINQWGAYSLHLKDVGKAIFRWGTKEGTDLTYDAKKITYSGLRLLVMLIGKRDTHAFIRQLLADPQFKPERKR